MAASPKNTRNPAVRRIMADVKELAQHPSSRYSAEPLEDNFFEWHFTIRGPAGSDFEGGIYHGRILLPPEYPLKPPNIVFLTRNGRFEVGTKICLSISAHHEESWQPAWGVRTMLEAIISFMPSEGAGAIGALEWTREERQKCARESLGFHCPICGAIAARLRDPSEDTAEDKSASLEIADQIAQLRLSHARSDSMVSEKSDAGSEVGAAGGGPVRKLEELDPSLSTGSPPRQSSTIPGAPPNDPDHAGGELSSSLFPSLASVQETPPSLRTVRRMVLADRARAMAESAGIRVAGVAEESPEGASETPLAQGVEAAAVSAAIARERQRERERQQRADANEAEQQLFAEMDHADGLDRLLQVIMVLVAGLLALLLGKKCFRFVFDSSSEFSPDL